MRIQLTKNYKEGEGWCFDIVLSGQSEAEKQFFIDIVNSFYPNGTGVNVMSNIIIQKHGSLAAIVLTPTQYENLVKKSNYWFPKEYNDDIRKKLQEKRGKSG